MKKNYKWENCIFIIFSVIVFVLGLLIVIGKLSVKEEATLIGEHPKAFGVVLMVISGLFVVYGVYKELKRLKFRESVFYKIRKKSNDEIKNELSILGHIEIKRGPNSFIVRNNCKFGFFELNVSEEDCFFTFEPEDDEYYDSLTESEQQRIEDIFEEINPLELDERQLINRFISFVTINRDTL